MNKVCFRFYEELNNYLPEENRKVWFEYSFSDDISLQDAIQSMGVPLNEIDLTAYPFRSSKKFVTLLHD